MPASHLSGGMSFGRLNYIAGTQFSNFRSYLHQLPASGTGDWCLFFMVRTGCLRGNINQVLWGRYGMQNSAMSGGNDFGIQIGSAEDSFSSSYRRKVAFRLRSGGTEVTTSGTPPLIGTTTLNSNSVYWIVLQRRSTNIELWVLTPGQTATTADVTVTAGTTALPAVVSEIGSMWSGEIFEMGFALESFDTTKLTSLAGGSDPDSLTTLANRKSFLSFGGTVGGTISNDWGGNAATASGPTAIGTWSGGPTTTVTLTNANPNIAVGMTVTGTNIAGGTTVAAINGTALTLSQNTSTASGSSVALSFSNAGSWGNQRTCSSPVLPSGVNAITYTEQPSGICVGLAAGASTATQYVGGTYGNYTPSALQYQLINVSDLSVAQAWADVTNFSASAGSWTGRITLPEGLFYEEYRDKNTTSIVYKSPNTIGCAAALITVGQSPIAILDTGFQGTVALTNTLLGYFQSPTVTYAEPYAPYRLSAETGSGFAEIANQYGADASKPLCVIASAVVGTSVQSWAGDQTVTLSTSGAFTVGETVNILNGASLVGTGIVVASSGTSLTIKQSTYYAAVGYTITGLTSGTSKTVGTADNTVQSNMNLCYPGMLAAIDAMKLQNCSVTFLWRNGAANGSASQNVWNTSADNLLTRLDTDMAARGLSYRFVLTTHNRETSTANTNIRSYQYIWATGRGDFGTKVFVGADSTDIQTVPDAIGKNIQTSGSNTTTVSKVAADNSYVASDYPSHIVVTAGTNAGLTKATTAAYGTAGAGLLSHSAFPVANDNTTVYNTYNNGIGSPHQNYYGSRVDGARIGRQSAYLYSKTANQAVGPIITNVGYPNGGDGSVIDITFQHTSGTALRTVNGSTSPSVIAGFDFSEDGFSSVKTQTAWSITAANKVRITLSAAPASKANLKAWFLRGYPIAPANVASINDILLDNNGVGITGGAPPRFSTAALDITEKPAVPTGLAGTPSTTSISVSWNSAATATGYKLYRDSVLVYSGSSTSFVDSSLNPSTSYTYTVLAYNAGGDGSLSSGVSVTTQSLVTDGSLWPGNTWNGTAGSGGGVPSDPTRTTSKPICRILSVPLRSFTDDLYIGVGADADGGIQKIRGYCEGNTVDVTNWTWNPQESCFQFLFKLKWSNFSQNGSANVYFKATANDGTMQERVIGPFLFTRDTSLYDGSVTVDGSQPTSGTRFATITEALTYCRTNSLKRPLITILSSGTYTIASQAVIYTSLTGWATITTAPGVTVTIANSVFGNMQPKYTGLRFLGSGITIDRLNIDQFYNQPGDSCWVDGAKVLNSGGRNQLVNLSVYQNAWCRTTSESVKWYFTDAVISGMYDSLINAELVRNCTVTTCAGDTFQGAKAVCNVYLNDISSLGLKTPINAMTLTYTGAGSTATVSKTGSNNNVSSTLVLAVDGSTVSTINLDGLSVYDVVTAVNAVSGWSATLLDNTRTARVLTRSNAASYGAFSNLDCFNVTSTIVTCFDVHDDIQQYLATSADCENRLMMNVIATNCPTQQYIFTTTTAFAYKDVAIVNCVFDNGNNPVTNSSVSQLQATISHMVVKHVTHTCEPFNLRYDSSLSMDAYSYMNNSIFLTFNNFGTPTVGVVLDNCHFVQGSVPSQATANRTTGGSQTTLFVDPANGDYSPLPGGTIASNLKPPLIPFDAKNRVRAANSAIGAIAFASEYASASRNYPVITQYLGEWL